MKKLKTIYVCIALEEKGEGIQTRLDKVCTDPLEAIAFIEAKMHEHVMETIKGDNQGDDKYENLSPADDIYNHEVHTA